MYKCNKCGKVFEDEYFENEKCDECGGIIAFCVKCPNCEEYHETSNNCGYLCEDCLKEEMTFENAIIVGSTASESVKLNGFLTWSFTVEEIEDILLDYIKNNNQDKFVKDYFNYDVDILDNYLMKTKYAKKEKGNLPF